MRILFRRSIGCILAVATFYYAKPATPALEYTFARKDSTSLLITLSFTGIPEDTTRLILPNEWAGQQQLYSAISGLRALSQNTVVLPTDMPWQFIVLHKPNARVTVSYLLSKDWKGLLVYPKYFRPVIQQQYFYFEGYSGLVCPDINDTILRRCKITYNGFADSIFKGNSFFAGVSSKKFSASLANLRNAIYCAGNYRFKKIKIHNNAIIVAVQGNFSFKDDDVYQSVVNIVQYERDFWNDNAYPYFFTSLIALQDQYNSGGTAHYNSFGMFQSEGMPFSQNLAWLIAHEYFHTWLGQHLKMPAPDEIYKWFSEGFTDYYAYKILYRSGLTSQKDFITKINQVIQSYYLSSYFNTPNTGIIGKYWSDGNLKQLSYQRGLIIAFLLENSINKKGASLDDLLKTLYTQSAPANLFSKQAFDEMVQQFAGQSTTAIIDSVNNGRNDALTTSFSGFTSYHTQLITIDKIFDIGFDLTQSTQTHKITGIVKGSNAEKAGLKEGEEFTGNVSIWNNNTEKPAKIQVVVDGKKHWIEYIPAKEANIKVPQIVIE